jgi:hypothetical protein
LNLAKYSPICPPGSSWILTVASAAVMLVNNVAISKVAAETALAFIKRSPTRYAIF